MPAAPATRSRPPGRRPAAAAGPDESRPRRRRAGRTVRCGRCGSAVPAHDEHAAEFRCPACGAVTVAGAGGPVGEGRRGDLVRHHGLDLTRFTVTGTDRDLRVSWRPTTEGAFAFATAGFFGAIPLLVFGATGAVLLPRPLGRVVFPGVLAATVWLFVRTVYGTAARLVNRATLTVADGVLTVKTRPLPTRCGGPVRLADVAKVRTTLSGAATSGGVTTVLGGLTVACAESAGGATRVLLRRDSAENIGGIASLLEALRGARPAHPRRVPPPAPPAPATPAPAESAAGGPAGPAPVTLSCPKCAGTLLPPPERAELTCPYCGTVVRAPGPVAAALGLRPARTRDRARFREAFVTRRDGRDLLVTAARPRGGSWGRAAGGGGAGVLALGVAAALAWSGGAVLHGLVAAAVGAGLAGGGVRELRHLLNVTTLRVGRDALTMTHRPVPVLPAPRPLPRRDLAQLVVRANGDLGVEPADRFSLIAVSRHGANLTLFGAVPTRDAAETLEGLLEVRLGLTDAAVRG